MVTEGPCLLVLSFSGWWGEGFECSGDGNCDLLRLKISESGAREVKGKDKI